jgi:glycine/serine hydroxymethyltransferase
MEEEEMKLIASFIDKAIVNCENESVLESINTEVKELNSKFPLYSEIIK